MALTAEELVAKSADQRKRGRFDEALISSLAAVEADEENADAWWQLGLNRWATGDPRLAAAALERTTQLAPYFGAGWARLGSARLKIGDRNAALAAFRTAFERAPDNEEGVIGLVEVLALNEEDDPANADPDLYLQALVRLDEFVILSSTQINKIGIFYYNNKNVFDAIKYWRRAAPLMPYDSAAYYNLGLAYNHPDVAQVADAIDAWRLVQQNFPKHEKAGQRLAEVSHIPLTWAKAARKRKSRYLLPEDQWYCHYINPLELLDFPEDVELDDLDTKSTQRRRKDLLKEIQLEDGAVSWQPGGRFDQSKAIGICDEMNDDRKRTFHWHVFKNKPLLEFLCRGDIEHFLVDEAMSYIETIELLDDESSGFRNWLSEPFAKQFDLVLSKAIDQGNSIVLRCLLSGRRWVAQSFADACFVNSLRQVDRMLQPLRDAKERAETVKPTAQYVQAALEQNDLRDLLDYLPPYFLEYQSEAVFLIRRIAATCYQTHSDIELAKAILLLAKDLRRMSSNAHTALDEDLKEVDKIIAKEKEYEVQLVSGGDKWEITKAGALLGSTSIPANKVAALRWGTFITRANGVATYDYLFAVKSVDGVELKYTWFSNKDIEQNQKFFGRLVDAAFAYLFTSAVEKVEQRLTSRLPVRIGTCSITLDGLSFETAGWFSNKANVIPWHRARQTVENGDLIVFDAAALKTRTSMDLRNTENAMVLRYLVRSRNPDEE